jgi:cbb3-type cytochrome oxidase subunit 3
MAYFKIPILITAVSLVIIIPSGTILIANIYYGTTNFAYGQTNQTNTNDANPLNIQNDIYNRI